jgi:regulator of protease activity HflC (stomatin/prohibitin superfamily)
MDLQNVKTSVAVNFRIDPEQIKDIYRRIGQASTSTDYMQSEIMNPIIQESVKMATAQYNAEELIINRSAVKKQIDDRITERLLQYHILVTDVSITDFSFDDQFTQAIEAKVTAQQNALREQTNIQVATNVAQQKIEAAKGDAQAIQIVNEQLAKSPEYTKYLIASRWDGHITALGSGSLVNIPGTFSNGTGGN